ncbi:DUF4160 domain-containing protein [Endozoicomonas sp. 8E]|uniref:DUF4160 domain-containing protein n=1 Tax=Endozoicomonas sp. 8E TaxID=3035692 RepID=UPI0029393624|nr:DUF4160 domain-containing protein [Endozoicomonas sp. 8E]WOG28032.1 DUF4160 domain-containing protein [Endozoicomonas sp. 8E]
MTVFKKNGYRFFFFSREEERPHVHVVSADGESKSWLEPEIEIAKNYYHSSKQIREIEKLIKEKHYAIINAWNMHFRN